LQNCWIVVRIDGKGFSKFSDKHGFTKPNDDRGLRLMNRAAQEVMAQHRDIILAYGQSDEYSFVFNKGTNTYNRRASKLMTTVVSLFASTYVMQWPQYFPPDTMPLQYPPAFDARVVLYPTNTNLRDYLSWRQVDCHINNQYNTIFWKLVQEGGLSPRDAQEKLKGTLAADKNEMLFTDFGTNYNELPEMFKKGTVLVKEKETTQITCTIPPKPSSSGDNADGEPQEQQKIINKTISKIAHLHVDIIKNEFWKTRPHLLGDES